MLLLRTILSSSWKKKQFDPKKYIVRERFRFWPEMNRKPDKTLYELAACIRQDTATCDFTLIQDPQDEALGTCFICWGGNDAVLKAQDQQRQADLNSKKWQKYDRNRWRCQDCQGDSVWVEGICNHTPVLKMGHQKTASFGQKQNRISQPGLPLSGGRVGGVARRTTLQRIASS